MYLKLGGPLRINGKAYKDINDRSDEQDKFVVDFMEEISDFLKEMNEKDTSGL